MGGDDCSRQYGEEASASHHTVFCHAARSVPWVTGRKDAMMHMRWEALGCASLLCRREALYLVSAQVPRETEPPRLCLIHATGILRNGMVPHALLYGKVHEGQ